MGGKCFNFTFDTRNQKNKRVQSKASFDLWVNHWLDLDLLFVLSKKLMFLTFIVWESWVNSVGIEVNWQLI